jgi:hypothetical protein
VKGVDLIITVYMDTDYTRLTYGMIHWHVFGTKGMELGIQRMGEFLGQMREKYILESIYRIS